MPPELLAQFGLLEDALQRGRVHRVRRWSSSRPTTPWPRPPPSPPPIPRVDQVVICTPDKDLGQCVVGDRVVQLDRRKGVEIDAAGVEERFGVPPASIPDYLALVGDSADGFPGLPGWGAKSAAAVLARYGHLEDIPAAAADWDVSVRGAGKLAVTLQDQFELALLFRRIATVERDAPTVTDVEELRWTGPTDEFGPSPRCSRRRTWRPGPTDRRPSLAESRTRQSRG